MFDDQAVNFLALLERKTLAGQANWLRYPKAYPYPNNYFLQLHLSGEKSPIDSSASYFMPCKNGAVFLFTHIDPKIPAQIFVQENLGVPLLALNPGKTTDRIADAVHQYLDCAEAQPDSIYQFFNEAVSGVMPLSEEEHMNISY